MRIRFGPYRLDDQRFLLERDGIRVPVRPKVFDLLAYLVRDRDRVVPREELVEALWGGAAVGMGSLSGLVNELRKLLREDGRGRSSIRTVHARGYQFVAPLRSAEEESAGRNPLLGDSSGGADGSPGSLSEALPVAIERALWLHLREDVPRIEKLASWLEHLKAEATGWDRDGPDWNPILEEEVTPIRRLRRVQMASRQGVSAAANQGSARHLGPEHRSREED